MKTLTPKYAFSAFIYTIALRIIFLLVVSLFPASFITAQQAVSGIVKDYANFWKNLR
jgi:hypothetical protein